MTEETQKPQPRRFASALEDATGAIRPEEYVQELAPEFALRG
jgi:hypothetical protein